MTGREYLASRLERHIRELDELARASEFDAEDPWRYVRDAAALLERFLQNCTLRRYPRDPKLFNLINALEFDSVDAGSRQALHAVRDLANKAKHDATRLISTGDARRLLIDASNAIAGVAQAGVPEFLKPYQPRYVRRYVIGGQDHLTGGEVELFIWLAAFPPDARVAVGADPNPVEIFQIAHRDEEALKVDLAAVGHLDEQPALEPHVRDGLEREMDLSFAWTWEGAHGDLMRTVAKAQHSMALIPGLLRGDDPASVRSAIAAALVELPRPLDWKDVVLKIELDYGISRRGTESMSAAKAAATFVATIPERLILTGPRWLPRDQFEQATSDGYRANRAIDIGATASGVIIVPVDTRGYGLSLRVMTAEDLERPGPEL
jgi:hypothetical protein